MRNGKAVNVGIDLFYFFPSEMKLSDCEVHNLSRYACHSRVIIVGGNIFQFSAFHVTLMKQSWWLV